MKIVFELEKETKNAVRYQEKGLEGAEVIGSLYVKKAGLRALGWTETDGWPLNINVEVEIDE